MDIDLEINEQESNFTFPSQKELDVLFRAVFGLTKKQLACFYRLLNYREEGTCVSYLVSELNSERSIIQKQLNTLVKKKLVKKEKITLAQFKDRCVSLDRLDIAPTSTKGYRYIYTPVEIDKLKQMVSDKMKKWSELVDGFASYLKESHKINNLS